MLLNSKQVELGWQATGFSLQDPEGNTHSLTELQNSKPLLIAFICNHCPYVKAIINRFVDDAKTLQTEGINVVAIMSNDYDAYPADSPVKMQEFAQAHNFSFHYLIDENQSVAKNYGAVCTPDFFGLNAQGELQYRGQLDDAKMGDASNRTPELLNAMRLIKQTGTGPAEQNPSIGCSIKWK